MTISMTRRSAPVVVGLACTAALLPWAACSASQASGWISLFNGRDFAGWKVILSGTEPGQDPAQTAQVSGDAIHIYKDAPSGTEQPYGYLLSDRAWTHYRLRFQYRWGEKRYIPRVDKLRDAGFLYHVAEGPSTHGIWPVCIECQVQEGDTGDLITVDTRCISYLDPATVDEEYPTFRDPSEGGVERPNDWYINAGRTLDYLEGWNDVEVIVCGSEGAVHLVNGGVNQRLRAMEAKSAEGAWTPHGEGKVAFQIEGAEVFYRRIELLPLSLAEARDALKHPKPMARD